MSVSAFCANLKLNKSILRIILANQHARRQYTTETEPAASNAQNEIAPKVEYPPILSLSYAAKKERRRAAWHEQVKNLKTVEEKLIKINMPKFYGYQMMMLDDVTFPYNCLPYIQHWTRTLYEDGIPNDWCKRSTEEIDEHVKLLRGPIEDAIIFHYHDLKNYVDITENSENKLPERQKLRSKSLRISTEINRILLNALSSSSPHLREVEVDAEPRHEAFWFAGGIAPTVIVHNLRRINRNPFCRETRNDPIDRSFQYIGKPLLTVRHRQPLQPIIENQDDRSVFNAEGVPTLRPDPRRIGYTHKYRHGTTVPGFWPGSEHEFGLVSYHDRRFTAGRNPNFKEDEQCAFNAQGILASFAWLMGQACYQGFSTYNDLTYPLTTQTIFSDGREWSFYAYQMNTTTVNRHVFETNPRANKCWGSGVLKLFEEVDDNGKVIGFNDEVIRHLVRFYLNEPKSRNYDMKPYLGEDEKIVADIDHSERRIFLEEKFKRIFSNRPRTRLDPEIYLWEKIYKIDNKTRPIDPLRKFFELKQNPWKKHLNDQLPPYIPKCLRPGGPKSRKKYENTYWP